MKTRQEAREHAGKRESETEQDKEKNAAKHNWVFGFPGGKVEMEKDATIKDAAIRSSRRK